MKILLILALLVITEYAVFSAAHEADEQSERMYEAYRREHDEPREDK